MPHYVLNFPHQQGYFDTLSIEPNGVIQLAGWLKSGQLDEITPPMCYVNNRAVPCIHSFRTYRPDVAVKIHSHNYFHGLGYIYRLTEYSADPITQIALTFQGKRIFHKKVSIRVSSPAFDLLLDTPEVLHREQIYGSGPPVRAVIEEIVSLAKTLPEPVLDFGCGTGILIKLLRDSGIEAYGIELQRAPIIERLIPEIKQFVVLYDGKASLPYKDNSFRSVVATEVIEHVPNYIEVLNEIVRIATDKFLITVPDMSAIPLCHQSNVVPWHLLEGTHVNFFNQRSLEQTLAPFFSSVEFARISPTVTNEYAWWGNIAGMCHK